MNEQIINHEPTLYIVPTPIGNLKDISQRALMTLSGVSYILSEDTRVTKKLLSHFNINVPMISYHTFNEDYRSEEVLAILDTKKSIALVSDAGTPLISDPGYILVKRAIEKGYKIISIPGANAAITALVASGLPADKFLFYGFLSSRINKRRQEINELKSFPYTIIFYEAPHRIKATLNDFFEILGPRQIVIARELTKIYEEYIRGSLDELKDLDYRGELVIIIEGIGKGLKPDEYQEGPITEHFKYYLSQGLDEKEAMKKVASLRKISKSEVYKAVLNIKDNKII